MPLSASASSFVPGKAWGEPNANIAETSAGTTPPLSGALQPTPTTAPAAATTAAVCVAAGPSPVASPFRPPALNFRSALGIDKANVSSIAKPSPQQQQQPPQPTSTPTSGLLSNELQQRNPTLGRTAQTETATLGQTRVETPLSDRSPDRKTSQAPVDSPLSPPKFSWKNILQTSSTSKPQQGEIPRQSGFSVKPKSLALDARAAAAGLGPDGANPVSVKSLLNPGSSSTDVTTLVEQPGSGEGILTPAPTNTKELGQDVKEASKISNTSNDSQINATPGCADEKTPEQSKLQTQQTGDSKEPKEPQNAKQRKMMKQKLKKLAAKAAAERAAAEAAGIVEGSTQDSENVKGNNDEMAFEELFEGGNQPKESKKFEGGVYSQGVGCTPTNSGKPNLVGF